MAESKLRQVKARFPNHVYVRIQQDARSEKRSVAAQVAYLVEKVMGPTGETPSDGSAKRRKAGALAIAALGTTLLAGAPTQAQASPTLVDRTQAEYALYEAERRRRREESACDLAEAA